MGVGDTSSRIVGDDFETNVSSSGMLNGLLSGVVSPFTLLKMLTFSSIDFATATRRSKLNGRYLRFRV